MAATPQQSIASVFQGFARLPNTQKLGVMVALAAAIAIIAGAWMWSQTPDYRVLYGNLSDRDGGGVIAALQQMNVPYKVAEGGAVLVPSNQVYDVRLRLASQGLPRGGVVGFELMENQKLGTSQFLEQVNYQRALEGELARSIQSLSAVQAARVHLAIPRPSVFAREQQKPSASVLLNLGAGRVLERGQINGILHLVASSVPELTVSNVTIVDQAGNLLSGMGDGQGRTGLDPGQLSYVHQIEQSYARRIESILTPILGQGNIRAQVAADLDFSQVEQTSEIFKPNSVPAEVSIRSQQSVETIGNAGAGAGGVPGALSNQPPGAASAPITAPGATAGGAEAAAGAGSNVHKESTVNYEVDKTIRHVKQPVGVVKRLSVAVVVNFRTITDKDGKASQKPLSANEIAQINSLVKEAMGYDQQRGDTLNVVNASFTVEKEEIPPVPIYKDPENISLVKDIGKNLLIAGVLFYLVFGVLRPLFRDLARLKQAAPAGGGVPAGEPGAAPGAMPRAPAGYEEQLAAAKGIAKQDPRIVANVVKDWVERE